MRKITISVLVILLGLCGLQCSESTTTPASSDPNPNPPIVRTPANLTAHELSVLKSCNTFGLNLFKEIVAATPEAENVFISPLSVSYALGLCYNGAAGDTRDAIASTLEMARLSLEEMNQAYHDLTEILVQADPVVDFRIANSFWSKQGIAIQPEFIHLAQTYFDARAEEIDFQAPWAADTINAWVENATNNKITDMVQPPISPAVVAMLFNAIYFKGDWMFPFDTAYTRDTIFYLADGLETECRMMHIDQVECGLEMPDGSITTDTNITFYSDPEVMALSMPYGSGDFRMTIVLPNLWPDSSRTVDDVIAELNPDTWAIWSTGHVPDKFDLALPRFRFEYEVGLTDVLKTLGMEIAFIPGEADFGNLFVELDPWIDQVKQKSFIQVDEKGTEAAAVTQVIWVDSAAPPLVCDRPFLILIHEDVSGTILFMGRIANPVWEE